MQTVASRFHWYVPEENFPIGQLVQLLEAACENFPASHLEQFETVGVSENIPIGQLEQFVIPTEA
jgi:hypothetical protein